MILKALYDYYHSLDNLPLQGMEMKEIAYVVVIDSNGHFVRLESKRIDKKTCATFTVAQGVGRTSAPKSNILWDNGKYALGLEESDTRCNSLFVDIVRLIASKHPDDCSIQALKRYYDTPRDVRRSAMESDELYAEVKENMGRNFSFRLDGDDRLIAEKSELYADMLATTQDDESGVCLITGRRGPLVRLTAATPVPGSQATASLVSMQKNQGYDSYGKSQAFNAPISKEAEFAYTSALKNLLGKESRNKKTVGDRTYLFWGTGENTCVSDVEDSFLSFLGFGADKDGDPNEHVGKVQKLFKSIWSGHIRTTLDDRFYILGLAPNAGRISVVSWSDMTLKDFACKLLQHFGDMEMADVRKEQDRKPYYGVMTILSAITLGGKPSDAIPKLSEGILDAIMRGTRYPYMLYTGALDRIRAELSDMPVTIARAAILKAYINRLTRKQTNIKQLTPMIDKTNNNPGYLCGRLAAVLEKVQDDANSGNTIRTRYMSAASATPSAVFPAMLNLSVHHSEKLNEGGRIHYEQLKQEIMDKLPADGFPAHLDLNDQGRFFVGYYHQRADFFTKKENKE